MGFLDSIMRALGRGATIGLGDWDTADPPGTPSPPVPVETLVRSHTPAFQAGWWDKAKRTPAHKGRIGKAITPRTLTVHCSDTYDGFNAMVRSWTTTPGKGNAAHWMIGRTEKDGVVQFAPVTRNANHAGGPDAGYFLTPDGRRYTPNVCSVGVEIVCAGRLKRRGLDWYHPESGRVVAPEEVFVESATRAWQRPTEYQMAMLKALWHDLFPVLTPWPSGTRVVPNMDYSAAGVKWAAPKYTNLVGHCSTNPRNKADPGPEIMEWLKR